KIQNIVIQKRKDRLKSRSFTFIRNGAGLSLPSAPVPGARDTCRSSGRCGADGAVRRNSCPRPRSGPSARQPSDACHASKARSFVFVQPWVLLRFSQTNASALPRKSPYAVEIQ